MELTGIKIDSGLLKSLSVKYNSDLQQIEKKYIPFLVKNLTSGHQNNWVKFYFKNLK